MGCIVGFITIEKVFFLFLICFALIFSIAKCKTCIWFILFVYYLVRFRHLHYLVCVTCWKTLWFG